MGWGGHNCVDQCQLISLDSGMRQSRDDVIAARANIDRLIDVPVYPLIH